MIEPWENLGSERGDDHRIFRIRRDRARSPRTGNEHTFTVLETPDWINVIPLTADRKVILIRQYRQGIRELTLEIPGGMVDPEDESPTATAFRELREETGYGASEMIPIGTVTPNPAFQDNRCFCFLAKGAHRVSEQELDGSEDIEVERCPLARIPGMIRKGEISHALVVAAFYFLLDVVDIPDESL